jgi:hypothetical protein
VIFIVFYVTAVLIVSVHLRTESSRLFNRCRVGIATEKRLKQQLWEKQLQLERLTNPQEVQRHLGAEEAPK